MMDEVSCWNFKIGVILFPFLTPPCVGAVSYQEFLGMFRKDTKRLVKQLTGLQAMMSLQPDDSLVGIDAKIPGGVYDSSMKSQKL